MGLDVTIRPAEDDDLPKIATIYNHEVAHSIATFDTDPPPDGHWQDKLASSRQGCHFLVAVDDDCDVVGFAYSWPYRPRPAYARTRETSIYLDRSVQRQGVGRQLYPALLDTMARSGVHTAVAGVAVPNPGSVRLHLRVGFEHVGTMREVGYKFDRWIDIEWYQRLVSPG